MTKIGAWASLLALLGVGVLIGGLGMHLHYVHPGGDRSGGRGIGEAPPREWRHGHRGPLAEQLAEQLELTAEQRTEIEGLLAEARQEGERLRRELRPKLVAQMQKTHAQIMDVLNEEQRARFEALAPDPEQLGRDVFGPRGPRARGKRPQGKGQRGKRPPRGG